MPSERIFAALEDIIRAVDLIDAWVAEAAGVEQALLADTQPRSVRRSCAAAVVRLRAER